MKRRNMLTAFKAIKAREEETVFNSNYFVDSSTWTSLHQDSTLKSVAADPKVPTAAFGSLLLP
jgi:hypothetical protein